MKIRIRENGHTIFIPIPVSLITCFPMRKLVGKLIVMEINGRKRADRPKEIGERAACKELPAEGESAAGRELPVERERAAGENLPAEQKEAVENLLKELGRSARRFKGLKLVEVTEKNGDTVEILF